RSLPPKSPNQVQAFAERCECSWRPPARCRERDATPPRKKRSPSIRAASGVVGGERGPLDRRDFTGSAVAVVAGRSPRDPLSICSAHALAPPPHPNRTLWLLAPYGTARRASLPRARQR